MPRRSPPTPLRLYQGPLPLRSKPKHTLPSVPRPTFVPMVQAGPGPLPRTRVQESLPVVQFDALRLSYNQLPIMTPREGPSSRRGSHSRSTSWDSESGMSPTLSVGSLSRRSSVDSLDGHEGSSVMPLHQRGPWDHSSSIKVVIDVGTILPLPAPAAINLPV
jgi:hypothetical protein